MKPCEKCGKEVKRRATFNGRKLCEKCRDAEYYKQFVEISKAIKG